MSLDSSSTYSDAMNQYLDNLNFRTDSSAATLALEAVDFMIMKRPTNSSSAGVSMSFEDLKDLQREIADVVKANSSNRSRFTRGNLTRP